MEFTDRTGLLPHLMGLLFEYIGIGDIVVKFISAIAKEECFYSKVKDMAKATNPSVRAITFKSIPRC